MNASRKRKTAKTADEQRDSINKEREAEASAEKKVLYVWTSFDQIYGRRWGESFGADPLGKSDAGNRMGLWIDTLKVISWPAVKATVLKIRNMPKPNEWWLPDLQTFSVLAGKENAVLAAPPKPRRAEGTWIDRIGSHYLLRLMNEHGPFSEASMQELVAVKELTCRQFNEMIGTEISEDWNLPQKEEVIQVLQKKFSRLTIQPMSPEEKEQRYQRLMGPRALSATKESSSSSTQTGNWDQDEPSSSD